MMNDIVCESVLCEGSRCRVYELTGTNVMSGRSIESTRDMVRQRIVEVSGNVVSKYGILPEAVPGALVKLLDL